MYHLSYLDTGALTMLVILRLDYCSNLYVGLPIRLIRKLQLVQSTMAILLTGMRKYEYIFPTDSLILVTGSLLHPFQGNDDNLQSSLGPWYLVECLLLMRTAHVTHSDSEEGLEGEN